MATIGLYDIELWHRGKAMPNLELMKVYQYHYQNNDIVTMMKPNDDEGRFNRIIYFKDNSNTQIPSSLSLTGHKKEFYGYGFYKQFYPLDECYTNVPPSYLAYEPFTEKFNLANYNQIKKSSYIRLENKDFSDYSENKLYITFADHHLFYIEGAKDFIHEHKNHRFKTIHRLEIKDEETFLNFIPYSSLIDRRFFICGKYSEEMLKDYFKERIVFDLAHPWPDETNNHFLTRIISIINFYKINNTSVTIEAIPEKDIFLKTILTWGRVNNQLSYYEYYADNKNAIKLAETAASQIRVLLKSKPSKMKSSDIDFNGLL